MKDRKIVIYSGCLERGAVNTITEGYCNNPDCHGCRAREEEFDNYVKLKSEEISENIKDVVSQYRDPNVLKWPYGEDNKG